MPHETVSFDEPKLQDYLGELVRKTVQDSLNTLLDKEANQIANAGRYEWQAYRFGHYRQNLTTTSVDVTLKRLEAFRGCDLRVEGHRALPQTGELPRGGDDGDVAGGRLHQKDTGDLRDPLGLKRLARHRLQAQP